MSADEPVRAAYGYRIEGISSPGMLAAKGAGAWPSLEIAQEVGGEEEGPNRIEDDWADLRLPNGRLRFDRIKRRVVYALPEPVSDDILLHPYLASAAAISARWAGSEAYHAGGFVTNQGVWGTVGTNEAGKSSLLARLALDGFEVMADDCVVVRGLDALAGPRCIDLRPGTAEGLGADGRTQLARGETRERLALPPIEAEIPLRGWVFLDWGDEASIESVPVERRFEMLVNAGTVPWIASEPIGLLDLASLPMVVLRRPRSWDAMPAAVEALSARCGVSTG